MKTKILLIFLLLLLPTVVFADAGGHASETEAAREAIFPIDPYTALFYATVVILIVVVISVVFYSRLTEGMKHVFFWILVIAILAPTLYLAFSTVYFNFVSDTGGPVHWHADFEIYNCGELLQLEEVDGFANLVGIPLLHHHEENRIHVEQAVYRLSDVSLGQFFTAIDGELKKTEFTVPLEDKSRLHLENGMICPNGEAAELQVFVYKTDTETNTFHQEKLENFPDYVLSPSTVVPPGDCIIIEFDEPKDSTEHLCAAHQVAIERGDYYGS